MTSPRVILTAAVSLCLLASMSAWAQEDPGTRLTQADDAFEQHRYHEAIPEYGAYLQANPDDLTARLRLATSYFYAANQRQEYYQNAAQEYRKVIEGEPRFAPPYVYLGKIAYIWGVQSLCSGGEKQAVGLFESAQSWFAQAREIYERPTDSSEAGARSAQIKVLQALTASRLGNRQQAQTLVDDAVDSYAEVVQVNRLERPLFSYFLDSSLQYAETSLYDQALIYLEGAWLIDPRPEVKSLFATLTDEIGRPDRLPRPLVQAQPAEAESSSKPTIDVAELAETVKELRRTVQELQRRVTTLERRLPEQSPSSETTHAATGESPANL